MENDTSPSVPSHGDKPLSYHDIKREVCKKYKITVEDLDGDRKFKKFVRARSEAWWRGRHELKKSYLWLAFYSGKKDHTTILHGVKRHEERLLKASQKAKDSAIGAGSHQSR